jgi:ornithine carbamoyltransferase
MIADFLTIKENFPQGIKGLKLVFMGDTRNNMGNSLMVTCAKLGLHFVACGPKDLMPEADLVKTCKAIAKETGATITLTDDVKKACKGANIIYTDIWLSMGEPAELWEERINLLKKFQVNKDVMALADKDAIFMHCLPSFHDRETTVGEEIYEKFKLPAMEVTDDVFLSPQSKVFDEAENRMHTIKAVMYATLK